MNLPRPVTQPVNPPPAANLPCSDAARVRSDRLIGSAPQTRTWVLIEHPGPWRRQAFAGSGIDEHVRARIEAATRGVGARILLIRRHGRFYPRPGDPTERVLRWAVTGRGRGTVWGTWSADDDLLAIPDALTSPADPADPADPAAPPGTRTEPLLLVCTHGVHDQCCAVRGRPVAARLAEVWPEQTWECTHVGGDRFAANLVILPDGVYYGDVDDTDVVALVREHRDGIVDIDHLRGITDAPPPAQAAVVEVHRRFGPGAADAVAVTALARTGTDQWAVSLRSSLAGPRVLDAVVERRLAAPERRTCQAAAPDVAAEFTVVQLRSGD